MNPRDIAFVIDLSGSMNDDTEPDNTAGINSNFAAGVSDDRHRSDEPGLRRFRLQRDLSRTSRRNTSGSRWG